jgi:hypothetical protein
VTGFRALRHSCPWIPTVHTRVRRTTSLFPLRSRAKDLASTTMPWTWWPLPRLVPSRRRSAAQSEPPRMNADDRSSPTTATATPLIPLEEGWNEIQTKASHSLVFSIVLPLNHCRQPPPPYPDIQRFLTRGRASIVCLSLSRTFRSGRRSTGWHSTCCCSPEDEGRRRIRQNAAVARTVCSVPASSCTSTRT